MDLSLVTTAELLSVLEARFDRVIFMAEQDQGEKTENQQTWKGHVDTCSGMALSLIRDMQDWARDTAITDEDEEIPLDPYDDAE